MKFTRRSFIASTAFVATTFSIVRPAQAATYKLATNMPAGHPMITRIEEAARNIKADTNGEFDIRIFPNSQLGGDLEVLSQLRQGAIQFYPLAGAQLSNLAPASSLNGVGFAFNSLDEVWKAMDGDVGGLVRKGLEQTGLHTFDKMFDNGFRQITSGSKPIEKPADLSGVHIRVPPSPLSTSLFKAFGAAPQSISFGEVYTALQTKLVDAQENPLPLVDSGKFYEVQKYVSLTNHMWDGLWMLANGAFWKRQTQQVKDIINKRFTEAAIAERADLVKLDESLRAKLTGAGMTIVEPNRQAFRDVLAASPFYKEWKEKFGAEAWGTLERYTGKLG
ncbi:MAG: TRAP transporter substrate-binding protein [Bosea sp.]|uniref:TRAP transporter substrate-binding protein n=1 Tax=Bosea sp. (in: a-proteobacteria) TaxID=1871050 RepID=UPI001ACD77B6|nr:TRAP transporter substrate-binding protein [Bosea sp. (in: a-proteobacteria)]MBN9451765.1 TRAP transporter substrate-binding protein [Bosea sp. (in: a-proteobacteria)]